MCLPDYCIWYTWYAEKGKIIYFQKCKHLEFPDCSAQGSFQGASHFSNFENVTIIMEVFKVSFSYVMMWSSGCLTWQCDSENETTHLEETLCKPCDQIRKILYKIASDQLEFLSFGIFLVCHLGGRTAYFDYLMCVPFTIVRLDQVIIAWDGRVSHISFKKWAASREKVPYGLSRCHTNAAPVLLLV